MCMYRSRVCMCEASACRASECVLVRKHHEEERMKHLSLTERSFPSDVYHGGRPAVHITWVFLTFFCFPLRRPTPCVSVMSGGIFSASSMAPKAISLNVCVTDGLHMHTKADMMRMHAQRRYFLCCFLAHAISAHTLIKRRSLLLSYTLFLTMDNLGSWIGHDKHMWRAHAPFIHTNATLQDNTDIRKMTIQRYCQWPHKEGTSTPSSR